MEKQTVELSLRDKLIKSINKTVDEMQSLSADAIADGIINDSVIGDIESEAYTRGYNSCEFDNDSRDALRGE